jgi:hypothetical protein
MAFSAQLYLIDRAENPIAGPFSATGDIRDIPEGARVVTRLDLAKYYPLNVVADQAAWFMFESLILSAIGFLLFCAVLCCFVVD